MDASWIACSAVPRAPSRRGDYGVPKKGKVQHLVQHLLCTIRLTPSAQACGRPRPSCASRQVKRQLLL
eukprot:28430-Pleurochrysis_carterae.AAC.1